MIVSYHAGMQHGVTLREHKLELVKRRVSGMEANARRVARQVFKVCRNHVRGGASPATVIMEPFLIGMVKQYGCKSDLVAYSVQCVRDLVTAKGLIQL